MTAITHLAKFLRAQSESMKIHPTTFLLLVISATSAALNDNEPKTSQARPVVSIPVQNDGLANNSSTEPPIIAKNDVQRFCESAREIEQLREYQLEQLKTSLQVDTLPSTLSSLTDPTLRPFLSPKVRAVVEAFPFQAEAILKKHGLHSDEFNRMLDQTKHNPSFRSKVEKEMKKQSK